MTLPLTTDPDQEGKLLALRSIVKEGLTPPVLVFVQSKERAMQVRGYYRALPHLSTDYSLLTTDY